MRFVYPQGKRKALTFSYDDGQEFDKRLIAILDRNGLKGTFHLNSGKLGIHRGRDNYVESEQVREVYRNHEVACHGVEHRNLPTITAQQAMAEIREDRLALERLTGRLVQGMSYAFGNYSEQVKQIAAAQGIKYSRTIQETGHFFPPADFLEWHPTCHHRNCLGLVDSFLEMPGFYELPVMYVWGHSFEFGWPDDWSVLEEFAEKVSRREDTWYATNMELCDYIQAVRRQEFSADGKVMCNPCALSVWASTQKGLVEVKPGELAEIEE